MTYVSRIEKNVTCSSGLKTILSPDAAHLFFCGINQRKPMYTNHVCHEQRQLLMPATFLLKSILAPLEIKLIDIDVERNV